GRRLECDHSPAASPFGPVGDRPALMLVYPDRVLRVDRGGRRAVAVLCACGEHGEPAALGWMGGHCGPCHDRRAAGAAAPSVEWRLPPAASSAGPVFAADG